MIPPTSLSVITDPNAPDFMSLEDAAKQTCKGLVSAHALRRWASKGVGTPRIKLKCIRIAGRWFVRPQELTEFLAAASDPELYRRRRATERTERAKLKLKQAGA
ncbi:MAG: hypothetical protein ACYC3X_22585 [Pirellulaceae bacterium]